MGKQFDVFRFDEIDSTNNEAKRQIEKGLELPALFVADRQTAGRGRRGKSFFSEGGLYMTLALTPSKVAEENVKITSIAAVAVSKALEKLTKQAVDVKWVNDIYLNDKKICGILAEAVADQDGKIKAVIIGVGVNLNVSEFPDDISDIAGTISCPNLDKMVLAEEISCQILEIMKSGSNYMEYYKSKSIVLGKTISYLKNSVWLEGVAVDINDEGGLIVKTVDGKTDTLTSGEISIRISKSTR